MIELGFTLHYFENSNIILSVQLNKKTNDKIPLILSGFDLLYYNTNETKYYLDIL